MTSICWFLFFFYFRSSIRILKIFYFVYFFSSYCNRDGRDDLTDRIDFIVCLGGDGTLLYASLLFQQSVPPVMAFHLGSLGFLTPFQFDNFQEQVTNVLEGHAALTLRSRLRCIIVRKNQDEPNENSYETKYFTQKAISNNGTATNNGSAPSTQKPATNILVNFWNKQKCFVKILIFVYRVVQMVGASK